MVLPSCFREARGRAEALARRTSMRVGGRPQYLFEPSDRDAALDIVRLCRRHDVGLRILGGGSNIVAADEEIGGAVLATRRMRGLGPCDEGLRVEAGVPFPLLVARAAEEHVPALSGCPGIPGTVGGAVTMNAGGRHGTVAEALAWVEGIDARGEPFRRPVSEAEFGYRSSPFEGALVTAAVFRRDPGLEVEAERARRRAVLREKQGTQPLGAGSSGCIFKNPRGRPCAGRLIDRAGLRGRRIGDAMVSERHANFIVNAGNARARDVRELIDCVREEVHRRFQVHLELEVRIWS